MPSRLSIALANQPSEIARLVDAVETFTREHGVPADAAYAMTLAVDEMAANSIRHAHGEGSDRPVRVELVIGETDLTATVTDEGDPFDPLAAEAPDLEAPIEVRGVGGLGIHIVLTMMDHVEYRRDGTCNVVTMRKSLTEP